MKFWIVVVIAGAAGGVWLELRGNPRVPSAVRPQAARVGLSAAGARAFNSDTSAPNPSPSAISHLKSEARAQTVNSKSVSSRERRPWDSTFLDSLAGATKGGAIRFELTGGKMASGIISRAESENQRVRYISGQLTQPEPGRFFFQRQTRPGVAGAFVGIVEFPRSGIAYRIEPTGGGGAPELVKRPLADVLCVGLPLPAALPETQGGARGSLRATTGPSRERGARRSDAPHLQTVGRRVRGRAVPGAPDGAIEDLPPLKPDDHPNLPIPAYQNGIAVFESLPGASAVIYLDFQGGYTPTWADQGITYAPPNFSNGQIRDVWRRVAEDFMPFTINVTTDLGVYQNAPEESRQRVIITPTDTARPGAGGVSYVGSFNWTGDTPCWAFVTSDSAQCAQACSHEAGHSLGLEHDGQIGDSPRIYYPGHGSGEVSWAPLMGQPYTKKVTQWCKGEYIDANNTSDQLSIIAKRNNAVSYRPDDTGESLATSRYLEIYTNGVAGGEGVIETSGDTDAFRFTTPGGEISLRADPVSASPNLAIAASLYDARDVLVASSDPQTTLWASIATNIAPGTYTFRVTGAGRNDPLTNGFSAYASLGYYSITGTVAGAVAPYRFVVAENAPKGTSVGQLSNLTLDPLSFKIISGNKGSTFALDNKGNLSVASGALLDYEALARGTQFPVQFELFVNILDLANPGLSLTGQRVIVAVANVNEPPALTGFSATVAEHAAPGTLIGKVQGSDPDYGTVLAYSISGGNDQGNFAVDSDTGAITVAGDLVAAEQSVHELSVTASDQSSPMPLEATALVTIKVQSASTPPRIASIVSSNQVWVIQAQTVLGSDYVLESAASLKPPVSWSPVSTVTGTGGMTNIVVYPSNAPARQFFRLQVN